MKIRAVLIALGAVLMAYAFVGALTDDGAQPIGIAVFLAGALVGHDFVWMPILLLLVAMITMIRKKFARRHTGRSG